MKIFEFQFVFDWFSSNETKKWLRAALEMKFMHVLMYWDADAENTVSVKSITFEFL